MVVRRRSVGGRTKYSPAPGSEALAGRRKVDGTESREPQTPKTKNVVELNCEHRDRDRRWRRRDLSRDGSMPTRERRVYNCGW